MKAIKQFIGGIFLCLIEVIVGILLLINPVGFTSGIIIACGIVLMVWGIASAISYFRMDAEDAAQSQNLLKGMVLLLAGGFCVLKSEWFVATFPLLTLIYGVVILLSGLGKVQWAVNMLRLKKGKWFLAAISAVISIACGAVILGSPFTTTAVLWTFTGISLICEAVVDIITFLISGGKTQKQATEEAETEEV